MITYLVYPVKRRGHTLLKKLSKNLVNAFIYATKLAKSTLDFKEVDKDWKITKFSDLLQVPLSTTFEFELVWGGSHRFVDVKKFNSAIVEPYSGVIYTTEEPGHVDAELARKLQQHTHLDKCGNRVRKKYVNNWKIIMIHKNMIREINPLEYKEIAADVECFQSCTCLIFTPLDDRKQPHILFVEYTKNTLDFPGGCVEQGEAPASAAIRNLHGLLGIRLTSYPELVCAHEVTAPSTSKIDEKYLYHLYLQDMTGIECSVTIDPERIKGISMVSIPELLEYINADTTDDVTRVQLEKLREYLQVTYGISYELEEDRVRSQEAGEAKENQ